MISFGLWEDWAGFLWSLSVCELLPWRSSSQSAGPQTTATGHCHHHRAQTRSHRCITNQLTNVTSDALQPATSSQDCNDVCSPKGLHGAAPSHPHRSAINEGQRRCFCPATSSVARSKHRASLVPEASGKPQLVLPLRCPPPAQGGVRN